MGTWDRVLRGGGEKKETKPDLFAEIRLEIVEFQLCHGVQLYKLTVFQNSSSLVLW